MSAVSYLSVLVLNFVKYFMKDCLNFDEENPKAVCLAVKILDTGQGGRTIQCPTCRCDDDRC